MSTRNPDEGSGKGKSTRVANVFIANDFVLGTVDEQVSVTYSKYGVVPPSLTYHNEADATGVGTYIGGQLHTAESEIGDLITVTLHWVPDAERRTLTLLVPAVYLNPEQAANGIEVETLVIWTTHREGREARGQIQSYQELRLAGTATWIGA